MMGLGDDIMQEPLVVSNKPTTNNAVSSTCTTSNLNLIGLLAGSYVAFCPQIVLSQIMRTVHLETFRSQQLLLLGVGWSLGSCLVVFLGMLACRRMIQERVQECSEAMLFQMEAHYIVGALFSSSFILPVTSFISSNTSAPLIAVMLLWFPVMLGLIPTRTTSTTKTHAYAYLLEELAAPILGVINGICGQFQIRFVVHDWRINDTASAVLFSHVWLVATVLWAAAGWTVMGLIAHDCRNDSKTRNKKVSTFVRMESRYLAWVPVGICLAWTVLDWVYNARENMLTCMLLLILSFLAVFMSLVLYPQKGKCDEKDDDDNDDDDDTQTQEERESLV
jgi:hypothetical protein